MSLELSGTTGVKGVAGSVSAPSIVGDDTNTGISFPSADTIKFSTGGVERMQITNSGVTGTGISEGKVLQVVSNSSSSSITTSGGAKSDLNTISITPASASNKILLLATTTTYTNANNNAYAGTYLYRGTSSGTLLFQHVSGYSQSSDIYIPHTLIHLDSPNTTSATTYTFAMSRQSINTTSVSTDGNTHSLIAMEIAA